MEPMTKEEFKAIRKHLGETQEVFAKRLGYKAWRTIHYKENGDRSITARDEQLLKDYLPIIRSSAEIPNGL